MARMRSEVKANSIPDFSVRLPLVEREYPPNRVSSV